MSIYRGTRTRVQRAPFVGEAVVTKDGAVLSPERSLAVWNHSPTGFEWGYGGSGPAQLALAILLEETDERTARRSYQRYKFSVIAGLGRTDEWEITSEQVQQWLQEHAPSGTAADFLET